MNWPVDHTVIGREGVAQCDHKYNLLALYDEGSGALAAEWYFHHRHALCQQQVVALVPRHW